VVPSFPELLGFIIANLAENALHYCGNRPPACTISAALEKNTLILQVEDKGEGIPPEIHAEVFEMFFRGSEHSTGEGLGLYVVKKAVKALRGEIYVESDLGCGTLFQITLPLLPQEEKPVLTPHL